jgi:ADP-ribose pyrophosphatase
MPHIEQTLSSKTLFTGRVFTVTADEARLENGRTARREVVHHTGGAAVVALNEKAEVALVRQFRYAVGRELVEIPAGKIEPGEPHAVTARRELGEEAGLTAGRFVPFGSILPTCAYCTERIYLYLATHLNRVPAHPDEDEFVTLFWLPLSQAVEWVMDGRIDDAKTVSGLLRAKALLDAGQLEL